jgi:hypothetical protein
MLPVVDWKGEIQIIRAMEEDNILEAAAYDLPVDTGQVFVEIRTSHPERGGWTLDTVHAVAASAGQLVILP